MTGFDLTADSIRCYKWSDEEREWLANHPRTHAPTLRAARSQVCPATVNGMTPDAQFGYRAGQSTRPKRTIGETEVQRLRKRVAALEARLAAAGLSH